MDGAGIGHRLWWRREDRGQVGINRLDLRCRGLSGCFGLVDRKGHARAIFIVNDVAREHPRHGQNLFAFAFYT